MLKCQIQTVQVDDGGLQIAFYTPEQDVKAPGIVQLHTLMVPKGAGYDDEITAAIDALVYLVNDVLEDWNTLDPMPEPGGDDDER
jgi:hypothetical protein